MELFSALVPLPFLVIECGGISCSLLRHVLHLICQNSFITREPGQFLANGLPQSSLLTQPSSLRTEFSMRGFLSYNCKVVCPLQTTGNHCGYHQKAFRASQSLLPWTHGKWIFTVEATALQLRPFWKSPRIIHFHLHIELHYLPASISPSPTNL